MERRDFTLPVNGLNLRVTQWGDAHARPVLMLHGIRGYAETFSVMASALGPEFRVIAFDQRGRGMSDWDPGKNYYTDAYVSDMAAVADALDLARFDLLGHSMGGINAFVFASMNPQRVRRMVIEDAGPGAFENSQGARRIRDELLTTPTWFDSWDDACAFMRKLRPSVSEQARESRLRSMLKAMPEGAYTWRYDHEGIAQTRLNPDPERVVDLWPHVRAIQCPTLVLRGGLSDYLQAEAAERMAQCNPQLQWMEVPGAGHYVHDDQPEIVCRAVREFLLQDD
jgi:pimeloyl-ACP methyl ester carboxylesterase